MTGFRKIAVSLPTHIAESARRADRKGGAHRVYVASAVDDTGTQEELAASLDQMLAESGGPMTPAERRAANRMLGDAATRRRSRSRR